MMRKRAQAAMEFLMTYGWAILVVLLAIGALAYFGVLSPQKLLPERTTFTAPIANLDNAVVSQAENSVEIALINNKGVAITLPGSGTTLTGNVTPAAGVECDNPVVTGMYNGAAIQADSTPIPNGGKFLLKWDCDASSLSPGVGDKFKAEMTLAYTNIETTQTITHTGSVDGKYA